MKLNSYNDWIKKLCLPCAIACVVLVRAMLSAIDLQDWWLIRLFAVLFVLAFIGLLFSAVRCFLAVSAQMATDIEEAHKKGMKTADIVWFFVCLAFGAAVMVVCIKFGIRASFSLLIGMAVFLAMTFTPMIIRRKKVKKDLINQKEIQQAADEAQNKNVSTDDKTIEFLDTSEDVNNVEFPANFPKELSTYPIKVLFIELAKEQILDKNFQPIIKSKVQLALLADTISSIFDIQNKWRVFELFWNTKDMKQSLSQAKKSNSHLDYSIYLAFCNARKNQVVGSIRTFSRWVDTYEIIHLDL